MVLKASPFYREPILHVLCEQVLLEVASAIIILGTFYRLHYLLGSKDIIPDLTCIGRIFSIMLV